MTALGAAAYTELVASTLEKIEPQLVDQIFTKHPTLDMFKQYAKSYTGRSMVLNIEAAEDNNTVVTDASGTFTTGVSPDIMGSAEYNWSNPYVSKVRVQWAGVFDAHILRSPVGMMNQFMGLWAALIQSLSDVSVCETNRGT